MLGNSGEARGRGRARCLNHLICGALAISLAACSARKEGESGSPSTGDTPTPSVAVPPATPAPTVAAATSYDAVKGSGVPQVIVPAGAAFTAFALADFTRSGRVDLVTFQLNYDPARETLADVQGAGTVSGARYLADARRWNGTGNGTFAPAGAPTPTCLHPRKAVVSDFTNDGYADVFLACHGYDGAPFPGETALLLVNDRGGGFTLSPALARPGFFHGAAATDVDGDGWVDVVVADAGRTPGVYVLLNQRNGSFREDATRIAGLQAATGGYYSVEITDVDGDARNDLIVGGHENVVATQILYGDAAGRFGQNGRQATIPAVPGRGVVLDFTVQKRGTVTGIYVGRTADAASAPGFYNARTLQWYDVTNGVSEVLLDEPGTRNWIAWWVPAVVNGEPGVQPATSTDNAGNPVSYFFTR